MHLLNAGGSLAHRGRNALDAAASNVAHGEDSRNAGLEEFRPAAVAPFRRGKIGIEQIRSRAHEPFVIERNAGIQPARTRERSHHQEQMADVMHLRLLSGRLPGHSLQLISPLQRRDLGLDVQSDIGRFADAADQVLRHGVRQSAGAHQQMNHFAGAGQIDSGLSR